MGDGIENDGVPKPRPLTSVPSTAGSGPQENDSVPSRSSGRLPEVFIIGAAKSATTSLYYRLLGHPSVYGGREDFGFGAEITHNRDKELCFFSDDENYAKGLDWYASYYSSARSDQVCIDASTNYSRWPQLPDSAERLAKHVPGARILYICRHPVDRAYSHYVHRWSRELQPGKPFSKSFEEHVQDDPVCLDSSLYMRQIERYLEHFPRSALHVILTTDLKNELTSTMAGVCRFIGIDPSGVPTGKQSAVAGNYADANLAGLVRQRITRSLGRVPLLGAVGRRMPQRWKDHVYGLVRKLGYGHEVVDSFEPPRMTKEVRERFLAYFEQPNADLAEFLGRDLSEWSI